MSNVSCINLNVFRQMISIHFLHDFGNLTLLSFWLFTYQNALDKTLVSRNCQWRCQKQNVTASVFRMNWRSDVLRISHKTLRAPEMLRCLHLWSLSNLLRIASVLREPSTLRCCPHWPVKCEQHWPRVTTSRSHTSNIVLARLAERVWYTKFWILTSVSVGSRSHSYLFTSATGRIVSCSHYMYTKEGHETYPICDAPP